SIATDSTHLFWIEGGATGATEGYAGLWASALDGTDVEQLLESGGGGPFAVDANELYFANRWTIKRVPTTGGPAQRLAIGSFPVRDVVTDGIRVYWIED